MSHDFVDDAVSMTTSLGGETSNFNVNGYDPADTKFNLGLGLDLVHPGDGITIGLSYDADLAEDTVRRIVEVRSSPEGKEGLNAFLEKRPAAWIEPNAD